MRRRDAGLTMVEVMVSVLLVGIAAAFVFSIQVRTSQAMHDQSAVSEVQQTLRAATDLIIRDLRQTGYLTRTVYIANQNGNNNVPLSASALEVENSATGPDTLLIQYADTTFSAHILNGPFTSAVTEVDTFSGFQEGDVLMAIYTNPSPEDPTWKYGTGCLLEVTKLQMAGDKFHLQHNPGQGDGWNVGANKQCDAVGSGPWGDYPWMIFVRAVTRKYRVKPVVENGLTDTRGILQVSPSGGLHANDWIDIAAGIVDLQVAMRVYEEDSSTDTDGDGDVKRNWYSGEQMEGKLAEDPNGDGAGNKALTMSVTLVAKTTKEVLGGSVLEKTPDIFEGEDMEHNKVGDHPGTSLPVDTKSSYYYGDVIYRSYTSTVDMRNMGIGQ